MTAIIGSTTSSVDGSTPGFSSALTVFPNQAAGSDVRIADNPAPPAQPAAPVLTPAPNRSISSISVFDPNLRTGYVQMWGLNVQREWPKDTVLSVGYVGNRGLKLFFNQDLDQVRMTPGFVNDVKELANNLTTSANVSPNNALVKIFGTASAAVSAVGTSNLQTNQIRNITDALDQSNNSKYAAAGLQPVLPAQLPAVLPVVLRHQRRPVLVQLRCRSACGIRPSRSAFSPTTPSARVSTTPAPKATVPRTRSTASTWA